MSTPLIDYGRTGRTLDDVPVFDVHQHVGEFGTIQPQSLDEQVAEMARIGIDRAMVSSIDAIHGDVQAGNDDVAEAMRRYPDRFLGYCMVTAQYPGDMLPELERCFADPGFRGVKLYQVGTDYDHKLFDPVYEFARERNAPVLAHTWGGNLTGYDRAAQQHPEVTFLCAHSGSGFAYQPYIDAAKVAPNLFLDLTYSREHTNMIERFVEEVGASRIVWGSDVPCFSMSHQIGKVLFARIPDEDKRRILYDNAAAIFHLD